MVKIKNGLRTDPRGEKRRYLVVSDLHLTTGKDPVTGRWSMTEDFFWDERFRDFLEHYADPVRTTLILNGDLFDFLQMLPMPSPEEQKEFRIRPDEINGRYGLRCTETAAEFQIVKAMEGHRVFFEALADFGARGNEIVILKGNHDIQLYWPKVQERMLGYLRQLNRRFTPARLQFRPWCYLVPHWLFVEHGNQYEETTAFRNFLTPLLPFDLDDGRPQLEIDLSGFLVRYVTTHFETINPLVDNIRPLTEYYKVLWKDRPLTLVRTFRTAVRYVLKAFAKGRELQGGEARERLQEIGRMNAQALETEACRFAHGDGAMAKRLAEAFRAICRHHRTPTLEQGPWRFLWLYTRTALARACWLLPLYALTFLPESARWVKEQIDALHVAWLSSVGDFLLQWKLLHVALVVLLGALILAFLWRMKRRKHAAPSAPVLDVSTELRDHAGRVSSVFDVRYVVFGHSHVPDTADLPGGGRYFNTGTWMGIYNQEEQLCRGIQQFTFLRIENGEADLLRWNPDARLPEPVIVLETTASSVGPEEGIFKLLRDAFKVG